MKRKPRGSMKPKTLYRITFVNHEKIYEIYARNVVQQDLFGFVLVENLVFGETSSVVVDPHQERLKNEFLGVKSTYIPLHSILRIDSVEKEGIAKVTPHSHESNISHFPTAIYTKTPDNLN